MPFQYKRISLARMDGDVNMLTHANMVRVAFGVEGGPLFVRIKGLATCYAMFMIRASNKFNPPSFTSQDSIIRVRRGFAHVEFGRVVGEVPLGD